MLISISVRTLEERVLARTKIDKEQQIKEKAEAEIAHIKESGNRALRRKNNRIKQLRIALAALIVLMVGVSVVGFIKYQDLKEERNRLSNPQEAARSETDRIKREIAQLIEVPTDEEPTIATVVDPSKLGDQTFFKNAQKDDRVVIYAKAKKAILYRPSTKKIIEVAPLNIGNNAQVPATNPGATTEPAATTPAQ